MKPFVVRGLMDRKGKLVQAYHPTVVRRVISPETAKRLTAILTDVVGMEDGTGKHARIVNVAVAGKTGTSQKFDFARRVYSSERVKTSFMGFFPAEDPQIAILVILDEPQRDKWGGVAAAPVFRKIGEQILTCFRTNIRENPALGRGEARRRHEGAAGVRARAARGPGDPEARKLTMRSSRTSGGCRSARSSRNRRKKGWRSGSVGSGWATAQQPAAGHPAPENRLCTVTFSMGS